MSDVMEMKRRLEQSEASKFLTDRGFRTSPTTLNKMRCVGGGPVFEKFGRRPLYTEEALRGSRRKPPSRSARRQMTIILQRTTPYKKETPLGLRRGGAIEG